MAETPDLTTDEMVEILKEIARDGSNAAARIAAIKELRMMQSGKPPVDGFAGLYAVGSPKIRTKAA